MRTVFCSRITAIAIVLIVANSARAEIAWQNNLRTAHAKAQAEGKLLLLHFYSDDCVWCDKLEEGSFQSAKVSAAIDQQFVPVKIHAGKDRKLAEMFKVTKFPTDVIVTLEGKTLSHSVSPQDPDLYVAMLTKAPKPANRMSAAANTAMASNTKPPAVTAPGAAAMVPDYARDPGYQIANAKPSPAQTAPAATTPAAPPSQLNMATATPEAQPPAASAGLMLPTSVTPPNMAPATGTLAETTETTGSPSANTTQPGLPGPSGLSGGANGYLAGARTESMNMVMPGLTAPSEATTNHAAPSTTMADSSASGAANATTVSDTADASEEPELAMQGYCAVTVINEDRWVEGNPKFGVIHLGKLYLFANAEAMQTFLADPIPYTPVLNEIDVVRFFEERKIIPGKREWGLKDPTYNRMFFFADEAAMNHFWNEYERYTGAAISVMEQAIQDANPGT